MNNNSLEIVIVGGGPAGISAGIYCLRAGVKALIIDGNNSALKQAKMIQNYYGIDTLSGEELYNKGIEQLKQLGGEFVSAQVLKINKNYENNTFKIKTTSEEYQSKAVILCMGSPKKKTIDGLERFKNGNVSYCAICDGYFYKGKTVAVIGNGDFALSECEELERLANKIYLITQKEKSLVVKSNKIEVINKEIKEFIGEEFVNGIIFKDGTKISVDGVFVAQGNLSSFELSKQLGLLDKNNFIMVDKNYMTNVAGVFAAGDMIGGLLQVSKAVGDGANAGLEAIRYVKIMEYNK